MKIESNKGQPAVFWIARVGLCGKPLRQPYTKNNSFAVVEASEKDFSLVEIAFDRGMFNNSKRGTCQQFITISDVRDVIERAQAQISDRHIEVYSMINAQIEKLQKSIDALEVMKKC